MSMTVQDTLLWGIAQLKRAGVGTPALDAELLLLHSTIRAKRRMDRSWLYAHPEEHISRTAEQRYREFIARREGREPVAYIVGQKGFYGLDFLVNRHVLVPRPESELLVEQAIKEIKRLSDEGNLVAPSFHRSVALIDVGTGSGAIVVAIAKGSRLRPVAFARTIQLVATDISAEALRVAKQNARRHGVAEQITFLKGNLLEPFLAHNRQFTVHSNVVIVANLPYLPTAEWRATQPEVRKWEPRQALDGGKDGLKYYRELFEQLHTFVIPAKAGIHDDSRIVDPRSRSGMTVGKRLPRADRASALAMTVLCEICPEQAGTFKKMVCGYFPRAKFRVIKDLAGRKRVAVVRLK